jgi:hypothetical protein
MYPSSSSTIGENTSSVGFAQAVFTRSLPDSAIFLLLYKDIVIVPDAANGSLKQDSLFDVGQIYEGHLEELKYSLWKMSCILCNINSFLLFLK